MWRRFLLWCGVFGPRITRIDTNLLIYTKKKVKVKVKFNVDFGFAMVGFWATNFTN